MYTITPDGANAYEQPQSTGTQLLETALELYQSKRSPLGDC